MTKVNKSLLILGGVITFLILSSIGIGYKFFSIIFHQTVYYCQEFITTLSINIPQHTGLIIALTFFLLFVTGVIKFSLILIATIKYLNQFVKTQERPSYFSDLIEKLMIRDKIYILKSNKPFAFCFGFLNPKIYLSTRLLAISTPEELEVVIRHEYYHLQHRDTLTISLASLIQSLFPFFPILSDLIHNYKVEREIRADQQAVEGLGKKQHLVSVLKKLLQADFTSQNLIPAVGDHDTLEERILAIKDKNIKIFNLKPFNVLLSIISIFVILSLLLMPVQAIESHNHKKDIMMVCLNGDTCAQWCAQHNTVMPPIQSKSSQMSTTLR